MSDLRQRILDEMIVRTPKQQIERDLWRQIGNNYVDYKNFKEAFEKAYWKVMQEMKGEQMKGWLVTDKFGVSYLFKRKEDAENALDENGCVEVQHIPSGQHWAINMSRSFAEFLLAFTVNTKRHSGTVWDARTWHYVGLQDLQSEVDNQYTESQKTPVKVTF